MASLEDKQRMARSLIIYLISERSILLWLNFIVVSWLANWGIVILEKQTLLKKSDLFSIDIDAGTDQFIIEMYYAVTKIRFNSQEVSISSDDGSTEPLFRLYYRVEISFGLKVVAVKVDLAYKQRPGQKYINELNAISTNIVTWQDTLQTYGSFAKIFTPIYLLDWHPSQNHFELVKGVREDYLGIKLKYIFLALQTMPKINEQTPEQYYINGALADIPRDLAINRKKIVLSERPTIAEFYSKIAGLVKDPKMQQVVAVLCRQGGINAVEILFTNFLYTVETTFSNTYKTNVLTFVEKFGRFDKRACYNLTHDVADRLCLVVNFVVKGVIINGTRLRSERGFLHFSGGIILPETANLELSWSLSPLEVEFDEYELLRQMKQQSFETNSMIDFLRTTILKVAQRGGYQAMPQTELNLHQYILQHKKMMDAVEVRRLEPVLLSQAKHASSSRIVFTCPEVYFSKYIKGRFTDEAIKFDDQLAIQTLIDLTGAYQVKDQEGKLHEFPHFETDAIRANLAAYVEQSKRFLTNKLGIDFHANEMAWQRLCYATAQEYSSCPVIYANHMIVRVLEKLGNISLKLTKPGYGYRRFTLERVSPEILNKVLLTLEMRCYKIAVASPTTSLPFDELGLSNPFLIGNHRVFDIVLQCEIPLDARGRFKPHSPVAIVYDQRASIVPTEINKYANANRITLNQEQIEGFPMPT